MSKNERNFNVSDAALLQHAETVFASIGENITDFSVFDSTLTEAYPTSIANAIAEVKAIKQDQLVIDEQAELTERLNEKMYACAAAYRTIAYFARKAFPSGTAVQNQFGMNDYEKARDNQPKMILFMESLVSTAQNYASELLAAGCNQTAIDSLAPLASELKEANTAQEKFKKDRAVITQERVTKLNALYQLLVPLSEVAQIIYAGNPAMLAKYVLAQM